MNTVDMVQYYSTAIYRACGTQQKRGRAESGHKTIMNGEYKQPTPVVLTEA